MNKKLPLDILESKIDKISQRCSCLYGIDTKILVDRMNRVKELAVVDNLSKNQIMQTFFGYNNDQEVAKILINFRRCRFYNKKLISFLVNETKSEEQALIHELLHVASKGQVTNGLLGIGQKSKYTALNEGVTQMFANDICEFNSKSYEELVLFAKVLRNTFGNKIMCDAYFIDSNILRKKFYETTKNFNYYDTFNKNLTELYDFVNQYRDKDVFIRLYYSKINSLLKNLLANIVVPNMSLLSEEEKNIFIENLLLDTNNNETIKSFFEPEHGLK